MKISSKKLLTDLTSAQTAMTLVTTVTVVMVMTVDRNRPVCRTLQQLVLAKGYNTESVGHGSVLCRPLFLEFFFMVFWGGSSRTSLPFIVGELSGDRSVAVGISDR